MDTTLRELIYYSLYELMEEQDSRFMMPSHKVKEYLEKVEVNDLINRLTSKLEKKGIPTFPFLHKTP